ncbi:unnamed protein product [Mytilus coruscus]|uniref:Uncharacterized protein n=1 Tax=Mytilus coruscus TaxID=42192 RepID=A0A6J8D8Z5_MYTCO|nr:unnamed protein product [Mytilus coruscus]
MHQIERKVNQCRYAVDVVNDEMSSEVDIKIKQNDEIEKILREFQSLKSFGEVKVVKSNITMSRETSVSREPQAPLQEQSHINNMTINIDTKLEINMKNHITDMICLMDGRVIVVEKLGQVILLTSDGKLLKQLSISGKAFSVSKINKETIAVTYPYEKVIKIFNMENAKVTKVITLDKLCWGLSLSNNSLAVGLRNHEIRTIDFAGNTQKSIPV